MGKRIVAEDNDPSFGDGDGDGEQLAQAIRRISAATDKMLNSGLNRHAISVLLAASTGLSRKIVLRVVDGLADLAKTYTTKPKG